MDREKVDKIIELFESILARPTMYFGKYDPDAVELFTDGFYMALTITEIDFPKNHRKVYKNRNWHFNALGGIPDMKKKGLTNEEIVQELLEIEIEVWKIYRNELKEN